ncbi:TGF-beta-activated kinase 1 and MAP3K7-binding protein 1-like [Chironomus tepperi]|uniref:TGF-beta-activated kinase 1 and MAP3K7-binding protein 1-like n=1 Tax=Chironomus tepperi TaxID=113505 RepID=UPI00391F77F4
MNNEKFQDVLRNWTDDLPICPLTGCGSVINQMYSKDGRMKEMHINYEKKCYCSYDTENFLYSICSGINGANISDFALSRMTADILLGGQLNQVGKPDEEIKELLRQTFISAEKGYNTTIDNLLATKQQLQYQILDLSQYEISQKYQDVLNRLNVITKELSIGSSVLIALITNKKLFIANLGVCRALIVKNDSRNEDVLRVIQVTVDHNLLNEDEYVRLCNLGLDISSLQSSLPTTRCIGNYLGKGGYKDSELFSQSSGEVISSNPEIIGPISLDDSVRFLLLLSGGLCKVLSQLFSNDLNIVNKELVQICVQQFNKQSTLVGVAQSVTNILAQLHHDLYMKSKVNGIDCSFDSREDMTLLIRNFSFPMPNSIENSKNSTASSTISGSQIGTITSYSSTNTSVNYGVGEKQTRPYVSFKEYFENVEMARKEGRLPKNIEFDDEPLE